MVMSGVWETSRYVDALGDDRGVARPPAIFGPGNWAGSHNLAVTSAAADGDLRACAYHFIDWLSAHSMDWAAGGQVPARNAVRDTVVNTTESEGPLPFIAQVAPIAEDVQFLPAIPGGGDLLFVAKGAGEAAVLGDQRDGERQAGIGRCCGLQFPAPPAQQGSVRLLR